MSQQPQRVNNHNESTTTTSCHSQRAEGSKSVRSVRSVCQKTFVLFVKFVFKKNLVFKHQEQRIREICEIRVPKNIRVIRIIRVQKKYRMTFRVPRSRATIKFTNSKCHR